jgi:hypothetical protein
LAVEDGSYGKAILETGGIAFTLNAPQQPFLHTTTTPGERFPPSWRDSARPLESSKNPLAADSLATQPCFVLHDESGESMAMTNSVGRTKPKIHYIC